MVHLLTFFFVLGTFVINIYICEEEQKTFLSLWNENQQNLDQLLDICVSSHTYIFTALAFFEAEASFFRSSVLEIYQTLLGGWDGWLAWRAYSKHSKCHVEVFQSIMESSCRAAGSLDGDVLITGGKHSLFGSPVIITWLWKSCERSEMMLKNKWMKINFPNKISVWVSWPSLLTRWNILF